MSSFFPASCSADSVIPPFQSLLIKGPYHTSAPLHLMISHVAQDTSSKAIMLTPSRQALLSASKQFSDDWLNVHGGDGRTCQWSSRVDVLYPPTPAHLVLLLSMLHKYDGSFYHPRTTVDDTAFLVVLHEISGYLSEDSEATISSYLSLISHALAVVSSTSTQSSPSVALAVFESDLDRLRLPILRPVSPDPFAPNGTPADTSVRRESVAVFAEKYFEWIGDVEAEASVPPTPPDTIILDKDGARMMRMNIYRRQDRKNEMVWRWIEDYNQGRRGFSDVHCAVP